MAHCPPEYTGEFISYLDRDSVLSEPLDPTGLET